MSASRPSDDAPRVPGSLYVTREAARRAVAMVAPMIEAGLADPRIGGSGALHVVVLDPARPPGRSGFEAAVLHEQSFGDPEGWDADYAGFARAKARLSWELGMDSHRAQTLLPHLLRPGDTGLWGSVWLDGIVVGASGAFPWYDEVYAGAVALALRALAKAAREADGSRIVLDSSRSKLP